MQLTTYNIQATTHHKQLTTNASEFETPALKLSPIFTKTPGGLPTAIIGSRISIAKQAVMKTGLLPVGSDVHRYPAAAARFNPLAAVPFKGKIPTEQFQQQIVWDAGAGGYRRIRPQHVDHLFFTTGKKPDAGIRQLRLHFQKGGGFIHQRRIDKGESGPRRQASGDFGVMVHKAGNTALNTAPCCFTGDVHEIAKIILRRAGTRSKITNGIKTPAYGPWAKIPGQILQLP